MAPEQARGDATNARANVYAIGAIVYHLVAGAAPYEADGDPTSDAVIARIIAKPPPSLARSQTPIDLVAIVERAMARDLSDRYASAGALANDLRRFIADQLVSAHAYSQLERAVR